MTSSEIRKKHNAMSAKLRRSILASHYWTCDNCGYHGKDLHVHHIVPIALGGSNEESNLSVLCVGCHSKVHGGTKLIELAKTNSNVGRKKKYEANQDRLDAIHDFVTCKIGTKECKERLGIPEGSKITDQEAFRKYMEKADIKSYRNNIDLHAKKIRIGDYSLANREKHICYINILQYEIIDEITI